MGKYRSHSIEFKRQVAQVFVAGETLHSLAKRHDLSRYLIRIWVRKYEEGALEEDVGAANLLQEYEARIAALERLADSDHDGPIFPNLAKDVVPTGPNQLWVSDITYVALPTRFIYVAVILDAWSRLIAGYAIGRSIDARLTVAAPQGRTPTPQAHQKADILGSCLWSG